MKWRAAVALLALAMAATSLLTLAGAEPAEAQTPSYDDPDTPAAAWEVSQYGPRITDNVVLHWNEELLQHVRGNPRGPTITARAIAVVNTAMYDAWAAYDATANPTQRPAGWTRRPAAERTLANKNRAISWAAYNALVDLFPAGRSAGANFDAQMQELGYPLNDTSPAAVTGRGAADRVLAFRHQDGANQLNNYASTTPYQPVNTWNQVNDRWRWQPLCVPLPPPGATTCSGTIQQALTPHWPNVRPFALTSASHVHVTGPRRNADGSFNTAEIESVYDAATDLTEVERVRAEYWEDGPGTEFPAGHWVLFGTMTSRRRNHSVDTDARMFMALGNALLDASIASWAEKYEWDFVRPITAIREHYRGQMIRSWAGPGRGWETVPAEQWRPYQAPNVVTPGFPEFVSGHSTFSAAAQYVLRGFTGSDVLNVSVTVRAGSSRFEPGISPSRDVTLSWPTFLYAAQEAGASRLLGGIHFDAGNVQGRLLGQMVGAQAYSRAQMYFSGRI